jgi:ribose transport system substrate-binding protein
MSQFLRRYGIASALVLAVVMSACSSPSEVTSGPDAAAETGSDSSSTDSQEVLQVAYEGQIGAPPTASATPPDDVNLWVVPAVSRSPVARSQRQPR